jgi:hypothetical protein
MPLGAMILAITTGSIKTVGIMTFNTKIKILYSA